MSLRRRVLRTVARGLLDPVLYRVDPHYLYHRARRDWNIRARRQPRETTATFDAVDWATYSASGARDLEFLLAVASQAGATGRDLAVDLGCGIGRITGPLASSFARVVGLDISDEMLRQAQSVAGAPNISYRVVGADQRLPLQDGVADLVIAWTVFRHVAKAVFASYLLEAHRVLKPGGCLVFDAQIREHGQTFEPPPYESLVEREYTPHELAGYARRAGFSLGADRRGPSATPGTSTLILGWAKPINGGRPA